MEYYFKDFVTTGEIGPIKIVAKQHDIENYFGIPDDFGGGTRKQKKPTIWKYGDLEIGFDPDNWQVFYIQIDLRENEKPGGTEVINLSDWPIKCGMSDLEVQKCLSEADVTFRKANDELNPDVLSIKASDRVIFSIVKDGVEFMGRGLVNLRVFA